jgi:hypothetical protein
MHPIRFISCVALLASLLLPGAAGASETTKLHVKFSPYTLGGNTTIKVSFNIATPSGKVPSPLTDVDLRLPEGVSLGSSTLGLATCSINRLETLGLSGCSPNSIMGVGTATVEVPFGPEIMSEGVTVDILMGQAVNQHTSLLFFANASHPVSGQIVFRGELLEGGSGNFGAELNTAIPLTPSVPDGPDVAVVNLHTNLGPEDLLYSRQSHGRTEHFRPIGIAIPRVCPAGGFRFSAVLTFQDGSTLTTSTSVPCLPHRAHR